MRLTPMNKLLDWLERRLGRFAVPNATLGLIAGQVLVFLAMLAQQDSDLAERLMLTRQHVLAGEVWRVLTYVFVPPGINPLFALLFWYVFFLTGNALESQWGPFRYNVYLLVGWAATTAATLLIPGMAATNLFLQASVFLAFARLFPDYQFLLFFILPVKVKWLAWLQWAVYAVNLIQGPWVIRIMVLASVLNYLLFFAGEHVADLRADVRKKSFERRARPAGRIRHECAVCGRNSTDEPNTQFRYCSQCEGGKCYCPDHLRDHQHVGSASA